MIIPKGLCDFSEGVAHIYACSFTHPPRCSTHTHADTQSFSVHWEIQDWKYNVVASGSQSPLHTPTQAGAGNPTPPSGALIRLQNPSCCVFTSAELFWLLLMLHTLAVVAPDRNQNPFAVISTLDLYSSPLHVSGPPPGAAHLVCFPLAMTRISTFHRFPHG